MTSSNGEFSALLAFCEGNPPVTGGFSSQRASDEELLVFSLFCAWTSGWANNQDAGDLRHHSTHYNVTVMYIDQWFAVLWFSDTSLQHTAMDLKNFAFCFRVSRMPIPYKGTRYHSPVHFVTGASTRRTFMRWFDPSQSEIGRSIDQTTLQLRTLLARPKSEIELNGSAVSVAFSSTKVSTNHRTSHCGWALTHWGRDKTAAILQVTRSMRDVVIL